MTEVRKGLPADLLQFLIDRLPQAEIDAAKVYLRVLRSREDNPALWFNGDTPNDTNIRSQRKDLLYRSLWFAEDHVLSLKQVTAIFNLGQMLREKSNVWNKFDSADLRNWIHILIGGGDLNLLPDLNLELPRELAKKAEELTRMGTYS